MSERLCLLQLFYYIKQYETLLSRIMNNVFQMGVNNKICETHWGGFNVNILNK